MSARGVDTWDEVWSDYRSIFERWGLDEASARAVVLEVAADPADPEPAADALKEAWMESISRGDRTAVADLMADTLT